jgi:hypothetical protein
LEGGFDETCRFVHIPFGNLHRMSEYFRRVIIKFFLKVRAYQRQVSHQPDQLATLRLFC